LNISPQKRILTKLENDSRSEKKGVIEDGAMACLIMMDGDPRKASTGGQIIAKILS